MGIHCGRRHRVFTGNRGQNVKKITPMPEVQLGAGLHDLSVHAEGRPVLVRVYVQRPELDLGVLPPLTRKDSTL